MSKFIVRVAVSNTGFSNMFGDRSEAMVGAFALIKVIGTAHPALPQGKASAYVFNAAKALRDEYPELTWIAGVTEKGAVIEIESRIQVRGVEELRQIWKSASGPFKDLIAGLGKAMAAGEAAIVSCVHDSVAPAQNVEGDEIPF